MSEKRTSTQRAEELLTEISAASPAGQPARFDPRYEQILAEIAKLDSPSAVGVEWRLVVEQGSALLRGVSKDLVIGAHVAHGLHQLGGLEGCATGLLVMTGLVDRYWPTLYPEIKRLRARANALAWLLERTTPLLERTAAGAGDREALDAAHGAASKLAELVAERMGADAPAFRPLVEALERHRTLLPAEAPPPPPPAPLTAPAADAPALPVAAVPVAREAAGAPATPTSPAPAGGGNGAGTAARPLPPPARVDDRGSALAEAVAPAWAPGTDGTSFLRNFGAALASGATELRRLDPAQPAPYRVLRTGLWLHFGAVPPVTQGKSSVPAPPASLRTKLELMATHQKWPELLEEAESSLVQHRLWLDLHRYSVQSLTALGASHAAARQAVIDELAAFLRRLPDLPSLVYSDGTPVADGVTVAWLEATVVGSGARNAEPPSGGAVADERDVDVLGEARRLVAEGKVGDGMALLQARVVAAGSGRARFSARLMLARALHEAGQPEVARPLFVLLDEDLKRHGVDEWEPHLAAQCLVHHLQCVRGLVKAGRLNAQETHVLYDRLCQLDPVLALKGGN
jgi:type VI secretion system protein VasJ